MSKGLAQGKRQAGFTFTEVLVAMLVLGISVMAFAGLQVRALQTTGVSHSRSVAMGLASDMVERIRANPAGMTTYRNGSLYVSAAPATPPDVCLIDDVAGSTGCAPAVMAQFDINELKFQASRLLPQGGINVAQCNGAPGLSCVFLYWGGTTRAQCTTSDAVNGNCVELEVMVQ